jgi:hypothetical protein
MTFEEFLTICESSTEPRNLSSLLKALWYDRHGEWDLAHEEIQDGEDTYSAAIHAYLHRKEGDVSNARYWYSTANRRIFKGTLDEEWESLARELVKR